jgi:homoserine kinase type II
MAVFTPVSNQELSQWLQGFSVGTLVAVEGIASGIENSNFFVSTSRGRYVLTLFENLTERELPFYINLMAHLARHGIPCPAPVADRQGRLLGELNGKPAALVTCLAGKSELQPTVEQCAAVGAILAQMHLAGASFGASFSPLQENPRGPKWWRTTAPQVKPFLDSAGCRLLDDELAYQASHRLDDLPRGVVHADLFRDNVLFQDGQVGGVIDFYFAGCDVLLFDVAVCINDWCVVAGGEIEPLRTQALLASYHRLRSFTVNEYAAWPVLLRAAALRFWLSRLYDLNLPRPGEIIHPHDPMQFRRILELRAASAAPTWIA